MLQVLGSLRPVTVATFERITLATLFDEGRGLIAKNWGAAGLDHIWGDGLELDVELLLYLEKLGHAIVVAKVHEGRLVGFAAAAICPDLKRKGKTQAQGVTIYIEPEHRADGACHELIAQVESHAEQLGVDTVVWLAERGSPLAELMQRCYETDRVEVAFMRRLK